MRPTISPKVIEHILPSEQLWKIIALYNQRAGDDGICCIPKYTQSDNSCSDWPLPERWGIYSSDEYSVAGSNQFPGVNGRFHQRRQPKGYAPQGDTDANADDSPDLPNLRASEKYASYPLPTHFVGQPCLTSAAGERVADAPYHLAQKDSSQDGERAFDDEACPYKEVSDDDGHAAAVNVGNNAGGYLEQKDRRLQHGPDKDELEGVQPSLLDAVDRRQNSKRHEEKLEGPGHDQE